MFVVCVWAMLFDVSGAKVPALFDSAPTIERPAANRSRISGRVNVPDTTPKTAARSGYVAWLYVDPSRNRYPDGAELVGHIRIEPVGGMV
jgi:hypothetical protein